MWVSAQYFGMGRGVPYYNLISDRASSGRRGSRGSAFPATVARSGPARSASWGTPPTPGNANPPRPTRVARLGGGQGRAWSSLDLAPPRVSGDRADQVDRARAHCTTDECQNAGLWFASTSDVRTNCRSWCRDPQSSLPRPPVAPVRSAAFRWGRVPARPAPGAGVGPPSISRPGHTAGRPRGFAGIPLGHACRRPRRFRTCATRHGSLAWPRSSRG